MIVLAGGGFLHAASASFGTPSNFVSFNLQGCIQDGTITFPNGNPSGNPTGFVCPDASYTNGNQGKLWNELDLVPMRLNTSSGNQAGATTDYSVVIAADYQDNSGNFGFDVMSAPVVNTAESDASCSITADATTIGPPLTGGASASIDRVLTIHQAKGTNCTFDWTQRLAIGAHLFSGSSLQSYLFQTSNFTGSKKTVPLPVSQTIPQSLTKTETAVQNTNTTWGITKLPSPATIGFGNVCDPAFKANLPVSVAVTYTKNAATPAGMVHVDAKVYATNPSARSVTVTATDQLYGGTLASGDGSPIGGAVTGSPTVVTANTANVLVLEDARDVPASSVTAYHDKATASYIDTATNLPIPQTTSAQAEASIQTGTTTNGTATIQDSESISGSGLTFHVASRVPVAGSYEGGYTEGTDTTGPVVWDSDVLSASGSETFNKVINLGSSVATTGALTDTATLTGSDGFTAIANAQVNISSTKITSLTINKTIPNVLQTGESQTFNFNVFDSTNALAGTASITFNAGDTSKSTTVNGLAPGTYSVQEVAAQGWDAQSNQSADTSSCSGSVTFNNTNPPAHVTASKVTVPALPASNAAGWTFTLTQPDGSKVTGLTDSTGAITWADNVQSEALTQEGTYTIVETPKPGWHQTGITGCTFTVNFPANAGQNYACTITNTKDAKLTIVKVTNPADSLGDSFSYSTTGLGGASFSLNTHTAGQNQQVFNIAPADFGTKSVTEALGPTGWHLSDLTCQGATNSTPNTQTATVAVGAGDDITCTFTNTEQATLKIVKVTHPGVSSQQFGYMTTGLGGASFSLDTATPADSSTTFTITSGFGNKSVTEGAEPQGWSFAGVSCDATNQTPGTQTATVDIEPGMNVTCTYTNVKGASLTIIKNTNPGQVATQFGYTGTGTGITSFSLDTLTANDAKKVFSFPTDADFGPKTVTESPNPAGWTLTGLVCTGDEPNTTPGGATATVNIQAGDNVVCTYTNVEAATLSIVKVTNPSDSGAGVSFPYTTTGSGLSGFSLDTHTVGNNTKTVTYTPVGGGGVQDYGTKTVTEGSTPGWSLFGVSCQMTGDGVSGSNGVSSNGATITADVQPGTNTICTYTNDKDAKLTIVKVTNPADSGADAFSYTSTSGLAPFSLDTHIAGNNSQSFTFNSTTGFGSQNVSEILGTPAHWTLTDLQCTTNASGSTSASLATGKITANMQPGTVTTCTYTNTKDGKLTIVKVTDPADSGTATFPFTGALGSFSLDTHTLGDNSKSMYFSAANLGSKSVTEGNTPSWAFISKDCGSTTDTGTGKTVTVNVTAGSDITCTFHNQIRYQVSVLKTLNGGPLGTNSFVFQLRQGASQGATGSILETATASGASNGLAAFATLLTPGQDYQLCEVLQAGFGPNFGGFGPFNPNNDPNVLCFNFNLSVADVVALGGQPKTFSIDNSHQNTKNLTIGYWKNHNACTKSNGNQSDALGPLLPQTLGNVPISTCTAAVNILSKLNINGVKESGDIVYSLAAQLLAAEVNVADGSLGGGSCPAGTQAISDANALLIAIGFDGVKSFLNKNGGSNLTPAQQQQAAALNTKLDQFNNNNLPC